MLAGAVPAAAVVILFTWRHRATPGASQIPLHSVALPCVAGMTQALQSFRPFFFWQGE
jgi:hypothetical protein